ncbi:MAG: hypothetical protein V2B18_00930, partial [Pseudomonadota bacterium]
MRDPELETRLFARDRLLLKETLFSPADLARLPGACPGLDAVGFSAGGPLSLRLHPPTNDLSRFNRITITVQSRSQGPILAGMRIEHGSDGAVSLSGGREVIHTGRWLESRFPVEAFGTYGRVSGWRDIRCIELSFVREKNWDGPRTMEILIRYIMGEAVEAPRGPRLSPTGLNFVLGVTQNSEKGASRPIGGNGFSGRSLGEYTDEPGPIDQVFRSGGCGPYEPANLGLQIPPPHWYPVEGAEAILKGHIMGERLDFPIPWDHSPDGTLEWTHFLNRH